MKFQVPVTMNYGSKKKICILSGKLSFGILNERNFKRRKFVMEFKKAKTEGPELKPNICHLKVKVSVYLEIPNDSLFIEWDLSFIIHFLPHFKYLDQSFQNMGPLSR